MTTRWSGRSRRRPRPATRGSRAGCAWRPGCARRPTRRSRGRPAGRCRCRWRGCALTSEGSTSSTELLIWRMTSAPDGLMRRCPCLQKSGSGFNTSRSDSAGRWGIHPEPDLPMRGKDAHAHPPVPGPRGQHRPRRRRPRSSPRCSLPSDRRRRRDAARRADRARRRQRGAAEHAAAQAPARPARPPDPDDGARRPGLPRPARQAPTTPRRARSSA